MLRTHTCGEITKKHIGKKATLCGWIQSRRDHGGVIFVDIRDRYGITQVVFDPSHNAATHKRAEHVGREWVLTVAGTVRSRREGMINPRLATGEIEIISDTVEILNQAETPPLEIEDDLIASEDVRLKYRYLDLRRPIMQQRILLKHNIMQAARTFLSENGFLEIETPLLVKPTPEGARDYVVPSRVNPGRFYALPQSPQLYKQLLMISGFDRYFQIARCLRDEDLRQDRQPEFTQIDIEMSFAGQEDIFLVVEGLMKKILAVANIQLKTPFQRLTYADAMNTYGSDKPDLRIGLELCDVTSAVANAEFSVFKTAIAKSGVVKCLNATSLASLPRNEIDELITLAKTHHAQGLAWAKVTKGTLESSIAKYLNSTIQQEIIKIAKANDGDLLLFVADKPKIACTALGQVRLSIAQKMTKSQKKKEEKNASSNSNTVTTKDAAQTEWAFAWITDFPMFARNEETQSFEAEHHPFCMPKQEHISLLDTAPENVLASTYDLVLNGMELLSGSVRIHKPEIQKKIFSIIGLNEKEAEKKFGFLVDAYKFGGPPHCGVGIGLDRLVALLAGTTDIREVIAFPKNKAAQCPMDASPADLDSLQLKDLHIKLNVVRP